MTTAELILDFDPDLLDYATPQERARFVQLLDVLRHDWQSIARPSQLAPAGDWLCWLTLAGRGYGKTRQGAEWILQEVRAKNARRVALVGPTAADVRDVMVEGESGILASARAGERPIHEPSKRRLTWPNGAIASLYSAEEPDRLRGPQHDCFVAGTMVRTPTGERAIEELGVGDLVVTRSGARRVADARSKIARIGRVQFDDGSALIGTAQHPVLTSHGWMSLEALPLGQAVLTGRRHRTGTSPPTRVVERSTSTAGCGLGPTAPSLPGTTSITATAIHETTPSTTWNYWLRQLTGTTMRPLPWSGTSHALIAGRGLFDAQPAVDRPSAGRVSRSGRSESGRDLVPAAIAVRSSSAVEAASVVSVASTWEVLGTARVYNLAVEDVHEYIANGVVVHNCAWADELAAWKYPDTWAMLMLGLRLGRHPRVAVTTTPRPIRIIRELVAAPTTAVTRGTTYENLANLAPSFREQILARYEGTRLARQELHAEILEDVPGAIFTLALIDAHRVSTVPLTRRLAPDRKGWIEEPDLVRVVVAVDPSASEEDDEGADEAGIVVVGQSSDGHAYVLADRSCRASPDGWGRRAVAAYHEFGADRIVAEQNNGGAMVTHVLRTVDPTVPVKLVVASRGKRVRAEPVAALFEQGKVHMVGAFGPLEDQLCTWTPDAGKHDDRMDALVWGVSELVLEPERRKLRFRGAA